jgi:glycine/D-amino acid oxidase-like deaminating enzyme
MPDSPVLLDVLIFGGGIAGLWTLDECVRRGWNTLLLEPFALGSGQTAASQGILHGGLKYMLDGHLTASARAVADMPDLWRDCLTGRREPNLAGTAIRSQHCYLWGTGSIKSRLLMKAASMALRTSPEPVSRSARPAALANVAGEVLRVPEQVLDPISLVKHLADRHVGRMVRIDSANGPEFATAPEGRTRIRVPHPRDDRWLTMESLHIILTAGEGNAELRRRAGLSDAAMQRRPLHMVMVRGDLPELFGHCITSAEPRATVTTAVDSGGRRVWQIGGRVAEDGVALDAQNLAAAARRELLAILPGLDLSDVEFAAYRIDRAEAATGTGQRPDDVHLIVDGSIITAWPTKLALAPRLAQVVAERLAPAFERLPQAPPVAAAPKDWPAPPIAKPPWETCARWLKL